MAKNYDLIKAKFLDFLADPQRNKTQNEFAEENGVNPATLSEWKHDDEFRKSYLRRLDELLTDDLTKLYKIIKDKAFEGDLYWARLYLQQINLLRDYKSQQIEEAQTDLENLVIVVGSEEEYKEGSNNQ